LVRCLATPRSLAWPIEARTAREPELAAVAIIDFYSHVLPGMQEDAAAKVDAAIRGAIEKNSRWGEKRQHTIISRYCYL
jgi:hypothetical protein